MKELAEKKAEKKNRKAILPLVTADVIETTSLINLK